ncbi:MAG: electron transfer flavoprotein subunit alpha, partial [Chloroflexi bacterium]|nr:electron transfer flavoprotein subunit alpha [Chloroflexota bacterium]
MSQEKGVLVFGELVGGQVSPLTTELLGAGRSLADDLGEELAAVFLGHSLVPGILGQALAWGADKVHGVEHAALENSQLEPLVAAMEQVCRQLQPSILLVGQNDTGRSLAPLLAF